MKVVKPRRWLHNDKPRTTPMRTKDGVMLECEFVAPKSSKGTTVMVWFDASDVDAVLLTLRENAIERRRATLADVEPGLR